MEAQGPPIYIVVPGRVYRPDTPDATHVPMFHQLEGLAIDEDITLADLQGVLLAFARQLFGEDTRVRLRPGYFPFTEPSVEVDVSCFRCGGSGWEGSQRCRTCKGEAWIEILGSGMVDPNVLDYVRGDGLRQRAGPGLRVRDGDRAHRQRGLRGAGPAHALRQRPASPRPVRSGRMRVPAGWLRSYCDPGLPAEEIADALTMAGVKLERLHRVGVGDPSMFVTGRVLESERHPNADRLSVCVVDVGRGEPQTIVCGAPNVGGGPDRGRGPARRDHARRKRARRGQAARRTVERDDPGRGRGRHRRGPRRASWCCPVACRSGAALAEHLPIADEVLELEITPNRPDTMAVYGVAREVHADQRRAAGRGPRRRRRRALGRRPGRGPRVGGDRSRDLPALHRARVRGREDRPLAAVAQAAPDGGRPAPDLERGRHHQLRDARHRPGPARLRPRPGARRADRGPPGGRGRDDDHPGRRGARVHPRGRAGVRRRGPERHRRDHGRPDLGGLGRHHAGC